MQIVNLSFAATLHIAEAASRAIAEGKSFRLSYHNGDPRPSIAYKVGEGVWSAPFYDDRESDPYRDAHTHAPQDTCPGYVGSEEDPDVPGSCRPIFIASSV